MNPPKYPVTYETYHVYQSTTTLPVVCESLEIAMQFLSTLTGIAHVEKVVSTHSVLNVFGTALNPLPSAPSTAIPFNQISINHLNRQ